MNKLIITAISVLFLAATGMAMSHDMDKGHGKKNHQQQRGNQTMPAVEKLSHALRKLDLSDEQKTNTRGVFKQLRSDIRPLMKETRAGHQQLKVLTMASEFDATAIAAIAEKEGDLVTQRVMLTSKALADALGHLTGEQRTQLDTMIAERQQRGQKHKEGGKGI